MSGAMISGTATTYTRSILLPKEIKNLLDIPHHVDRSSVKMPPEPREMGNIDVKGSLELNSEMFVQTDETMLRTRVIST